MNLSRERETNLPINQFHDWIKPSAQKDSVDFDVHGFHQEKTNILFLNGKLKTCSVSETMHLNLRVLKDGKAGYSYTKDFSRESLQNCYQKALDGLKLSDKKEGGGLSKNQTYKDFSHFYDKNLNTLSLEDKIKTAEEMDKAVSSFNKKSRPVYSSVSDHDTLRFFVNSEGCGHTYKSGGVFAYSESLAEEKNSRAVGQSEQNSKNYRLIDFKGMGAKSADRAVKKLNHSLPATKKYPVVFQSGEAVGNLLHCIVGFLSGKAVFEGLSLFKDSLEKKILSPQFSLRDDPFASWGGLVKVFDGEGFAVEQTPLIENGFLRNYLTCSFFSKALKIPHTKKAAYIGGQNTLDIQETHLVMEEGDSAFEELVTEFPEVIVIDNLKSFAGYNSVSGDFSIESEGFLWKGGEGRPLCQFTVSGNIREVFANILKTGKDSEVFRGTVKAPSFLTPDLMIAGK